MFPLRHQDLHTPRPHDRLEEHLQIPTQRLLRADGFCPRDAIRKGTVPQSTFERGWSYLPNSPPFLDEMEVNNASITPKRRSTCASSTFAQENVPEGSRVTCPTAELKPLDRMSPPRSTSASKRFSPFPDLPGRGKCRRHQKYIRPRFQPPRSMHPF